MSISSLLIFAITGGIACAILGVIIGRAMAMHGFTWTFKDALGLALIAAFIAALFILFWKAIPPANEQLIVFMLGQISGFVGGVVSSHYGSKHGEEKQEEQRQVTAQEQAKATRATAQAVAAAAKTQPTTNSVQSSDVDNDGMPWDERIHSSTKEKDGEGLWIKRGDVDQTVIEGVEAEIKGNK